jgi:hypothetical protein
MTRNPVICGPGKIVLGGGVGHMLQLGRANLRNIPAIAQR